MFEMLVYIMFEINEINPHSLYFVTYFLFIFTHEALPHRGFLHTIFCIAYLRICREGLPQKFTVAICRESFSQEFVVGIFSENLPWLFAVGFLYM